MGFDTGLFIQQPVDDNYICQICYDVQEKPKTVCENGHTFCGGCIAQYKKEGTLFRPSGNCPSCRVRMSSKEVPNLPLQSIIMGLSVRCSRSESGCPWTGKLDSYSNCHNKDDGCDYKLIACENCDELVSTNKMESHIEFECPERTVSCPFCHDLFVAKNLEHHKSDRCPDRLVDCCFCFESFTAKTLKDHEENQCQERLINCSLCRQLFTVRALRGHEDSECLERMVQCSECDKDVKVKVLGKHKTKECRGRLVACSHCSVQVASKDLGTITTAAPGTVKTPVVCTGHMLVCPRVPVPCEFACHGCKEMIPRQDVEHHGNEFLGKHSQLLSEAMKKMQEDSMWQDVTMEWNFSSSNFYQLDSELKTKLVPVGAFEVGVGLTVMEDDDESIQVKLRTLQRGFSTQFDNIRVKMERDVKDEETLGAYYEWTQPGTLTPAFRINDKGKTCQFVMVPLAAGTGNQEKITLDILRDIIREVDGCKFSFSFRLRKPSALTVSV